MIGTIYKLTSPSGKIYIGQTTNLKDRKRCLYNTNKYYSGHRLDNAIKKYGIENFDFQVIAEVSQDEYSKIRTNPFRRVTNRRALRVNHGTSDRLIYPNIIDTTKPITHRVWGLIKPTPIILEGIDDPTLTIEGFPVNEPKECILDSSIHRMILDRAVLYAKQAYIGGQVQE